MLHLENFTVKDVMDYFEQSNETLSDLAVLKISFKLKEDLKLINNLPNRLKKFFINRFTIPILPLDYLSNSLKNLLVFGEIKRNDKSIINLPNSIDTLDICINSCIKQIRIPCSVKNIKFFAQVKKMRLRKQNMYERYNIQNFFYKKKKCNKTNTEVLYFTVRYYDETKA